MNGVVKEKPKYVVILTMSSSLIEKINKQNLKNQTTLIYWKLNLKRCVNQFGSDGSPINQSVKLPINL